MKKTGSRKSRWSVPLKYIIFVAKTLFTKTSDGCSVVNIYSYLHFVTCSEWMFQALAGMAATTCSQHWTPNLGGGSSRNKSFMFSLLHCHTFSTILYDQLKILSFDNDTQYCTKLLAFAIVLKNSFNQFLIHHVNVNVNTTMTTTELVVSFLFICGVKIKYFVSEKKIRRIWRSEEVAKFNENLQEDQETLTQ